MLDGLSHSFRFGFLADATFCYYIHALSDVLLAFPDAICGNVISTEYSMNLYLHILKLSFACCIQ